MRAAAGVVVVEQEGAEVPHISEQRREGSLQPVLSKLRGKEDEGETCATHATGHEDQPGRIVGDPGALSLTPYPRSWMHREDL